MLEIIQGIQISRLYTDIPNLLTELDKHFAIEVPGRDYIISYQNHSWDGLRHFFSKLRGTFPTGLTYQVVQYLKEKQLTPTIECLYKNLKPSNVPLVQFLIGIELRDYQKDAIKILLKKKRGIIKASTNYGKSNLSAEFIRIMNKPTLYIVDRRVLLHQTAEALHKVLGVKIGKVGDGLNDIQQITVAMPQTLIERAPSKEGRKGKLRVKSEFLTLVNRPILILDECDTIGDARIEKVIETCSAPVRIAMSGTPLLNDEITNQTLIGHFGEIIYEMKNAELIEKGVSSKPTVRVIRIDSKGIERANYTMAYTLGVVRNTERNRRIVECSQITDPRGLNTLIIAKEVAHVMELHRLIKDSDFVHYDISSKERNIRLERFKNERGRVLVASSILDRGVDISSIGRLILAGGGRSVKQVLQRIGRGLRANELMQVDVIEFLDTGNRILLEHSIIRINAMKEEGFDIEMY